MVGYENRESGSEVIGTTMVKIKARLFSSGGGHLYRYREDMKHLSFDASSTQNSQIS